jgi:hypothetical protein
LLLPGIEPPVPTFYLLTSSLFIGAINGAMTYSYG